MSSYESYFQRVREAIEECAEPSESSFSVERDPGFWDDFLQIEIAGRTRDESKARWLAEFTQFDEFDDDGKRFILATLALEALGQMPHAAFVAGEAIVRGLPVNASFHRKVGVCKIFERSKSREAKPLIKELVDDADDRLRSEIQSIFDSL